MVSSAVEDACRAAGAVVVCGCAGLAGSRLGLDASPGQDRDGDRAWAVRADLLAAGGDGCRAGRDCAGAAEGDGSDGTGAAVLCHRRGAGHADPERDILFSVAHLPAGIMSIIIATVPMLAFPMALALGMDRFSALRLAGLALGLAGCGAAGGAGGGPAGCGDGGVLPVALIGPLFYAIEATYVAHRGTQGWMRCRRCWGQV
jgi:hypothetical protein